MNYALRDALNLSLSERCCYVSGRITALVRASSHRALCAIHAPLVGTRKLKYFVISHRMQFSHRTCIIPEDMILALNCTKYNNGRT